MKRNAIYACLCASGLAFLLGLGGTLCMITGLRLSAEFLPLAAGCALGAVIAAGCLYHRRGELILSGIAVLYTALVAFSQDFQNQLFALCFRIMDLYRRGYGISIPPQIEGCTAESHLLPLLFIAGIVIAATAWTVMRRIVAVPAALLAILPLVSCLVVTDTVPDALPIFLLMLGLILLMLTQNVRRQNTANGNRLTAALSLPTAAALAVLFLLVPANGYEPPIQLSSMEDLISWISTKIPTLDTTSDGDLVISYGASAKNNVDLASLGNRIERQTPVMEITTDYSGTLYLRGQDFDVYTGLSWDATSGRIETNYGFSAFVWQEPSHHVETETLGRHGLFYIPCYPTEHKTLTGGMIANPDNVTSYSYTFSPLRPDWKQIWASLYGNGFISGSPQTDARYLQLPEDVQLRANILLYQAGLTNGRGTIVERADAIAYYVKTSASYNSNTSRMPADETDFALWFLESSDTGYCVHFATATTVLLRAAGIPARYVEGYTISTEPGQNTLIRQKDAHAWVEYYVPYVGWVILDPTPGAAQPPIESTTVPTEPTETVPTEPTEETQPPVTSAPDVPSEIISVPDVSQPSVSEPDQTAPPRWFIKILTVIFCFAAVSFLVVGQWYLRRRLKLKRMTTGSTNAQAIARYREALLLSRLSHIPIPDDVQNLAQKARFSQHQLTAKELKQFTCFQQQCTQTLTERSWYRRLIDRFLFAAY